METIRIQKDGSIPGVYLSKEEGIFEFTGKSLPENVLDFYESIFSWINEYANNPNSETHIVFKMEYFNTASSKCFLEILKAFQAIQSADKSKVLALWYYEEEDEDMKEEGETLCDLAKIAYEMIPVEELS